MTPASRSSATRLAPGFSTLRAAALTCAADGLSIWDALIVETAREAGAGVLYTEDARLLRAVNGEADPGGAVTAEPHGEPEPRRCRVCPCTQAIAGAGRWVPRCPHTG